MQTETTQPPLMTLTEVADYLNFSPRYIQTLVARQEIPFTKMPGDRGELRFRMSKINSWLDQRSINPKKVGS